MGIRDASSSEVLDSELHFDVCVIGSGAAGMTLAREFADSSHRVAVLEAGGLTVEPESQALYEGESVGLPYHDLDMARTRRFGGSTHCWGGFCRAFYPLDFKTRETVPHSGWPFQLGDLEDHYRRAHEVCQLGPLRYDLGFWSEWAKDLVNPFEDHSRVDLQVLQKANLTPETHRAALEAAENVTVILHAAVLRLLFDETGTKVTAAKVSTPDGRHFRVSAQNFVLAAGGIENPRILLASADSNLAPGNHSGLVGRFFMDHLNIRAGYFRPADRRFFEDYAQWREVKGVTIRGALALSDSVREEEGLLRCFFDLNPLPPKHAQGYLSTRRLLNSIGQRRPTRNLAYHLRNLALDSKIIADLVQRKLTRQSTDEFRWPAGDLIPLRVSAEPAPNPDSRVLLSRRVDRLGVPKARLDWRLSPIDFAHVQRSLELLSEAARAAGVGDVQIHPQTKWAIWGHYHHIGTTRMDPLPQNGVVNENCRVHGISNLFVAGSSVFPTAGGGTATLMIVVLAIRLADHLKDLLSSERAASRS